MADMSKLIDGPIPSLPIHPTKRSREDAGIDDEPERRSAPRGLTTLNSVVNRQDSGHVDWYSAVPGPSLHASVSQDSHLPTPRSYGSHSGFPFFPTAVGSPESPLLYNRSRTLGGSSSAGMTPCIPCRDHRVDSSSASARNPVMQPTAITPQASPMTSPISLPARPLSLPLLSSSQKERPIFVKTESPPPVLAPAYDISPSKGSSPIVSTEVQTPEISLSSPFLEKSKPVARINSKREDALESFPSTSQTLFLSSPAHIEERHPLPARPSSLAQISTEELARQPGGELNRIRNQLSEVEDARKVELESRRPEYLKRLQREDGMAFSLPSIEAGPVEKDSIGIMETPARGRRIQLFDFQETSAESFEESLMTHGYGTYGVPRTPHVPLAATEGLSREAMDWLVYNTPAAVPGSVNSGLGQDVELNEKELKKRKRLEAFKGSAARAYAKLYPAEVEGLGRVLLNVPPEDVDELTGSPAKKRATGRKKRGAAAEKKNKMQAGSVPAQTECTAPRWLDREIPWCLREREREEDMRARDAERIKWIDSYFAQDTTDEDSDKNEEDGVSPAWDHEAEEPPETLKRGRGKAVPLQANPNRKETVPGDAKKTRNLFFPSDPADARTALMSKRSVRLLAQRKLRQNGQRAASLRGYGEGRLACACGRDDDDDGRPAVQCDDCYNWHHLECIGIRHESELGARDDPWFCAACTARSDAAFSASDWRNQRQPTFVPTDDRPVHTSTKSDVAFYSSSPLRDWESSGSLQTPVQGQGRLFNSESSRRSIWDDPHAVSSPSTPLTTSRGVRLHTPGATEQRPNNMFDPMISPRTSFPKSPMTFTTPKNRSSGAGAGGSGFGLPWTPQGSGLFATPTPHGRGSSGYGFSYGSDDPINAQFNHSLRVDAMYATDDTPIRRAPVQSRTLGLSGHSSSSSLVDSPLAGRGGHGSEEAHASREMLRSRI